MYWILFIGIALASWLVSWNLKRKFKEYSKISIGGGLNGRDIAEKMLRENGISDVKIVTVNGSLTDHYNPTTKVVNLSEDVFFGNSVAAAAVAAHECGHAIQHAKAYAPLKMRSALVPVVSFASQWVQWILLLGILMIGSNGQGNSTVLLIGVILFAMTTLFSFITLPVEIDASMRALTWLRTSGITNSFNHNKAEGALRSAAYTYVVAALGSLATLLYYVSILLGGKRNE